MAVAGDVVQDQGKHLIAGFHREQQGPYRRLLFEPERAPDELPQRRVQLGLSAIGTF